MALFQTRTRIKPDCPIMRRIKIYDTTLRDGSQAEGISFSLQDKLQHVRRLDDLGFDYVEGGYPGSNEKDFQFFQEVARMKLKHTKVAAFGMTRRKGVAASEDVGLRSLLDSQAPVITLVGKASAFQVKEVIRADLDENLTMIAESVALMIDAGREVVFDAEHFFDGYKENPEYSLKTIHAAVDAGATSVVLCDTNGGSMVDEVAKITAEVACSLGERVAVGIHCHNDCELAVGNALAAVRAGATQVQGTINGFGERCGNTDLISVIANLGAKFDCYQVLLGTESLKYLTELSRFIYEMANMNFRNNQPFVGKSAFAHKGGMHVSAIARNSSSYEHIDPAMVGNERRVLVSELSGRSNIVALTSKFGHQLDKKLMDKVLAQVVSLENVGYQFEAAEGSFYLLVKKCTGKLRPHFQRQKCHVSVVMDKDGNTTTEATVKLKIGDESCHVVAEGDGPVNALDAAMRKALNGHFPALHKTHLIDYKVRVINSEAATAAGVRVVIESQDENDVWGTVGVSENVIEASWQALVDSIEYKLHKDEDAAGA
jgi:2-isopropylmalate synthase